MENSKIEWCHDTFNPWIGCTKVSAGCDHCYAESRDQRFAGGAHWGPSAPRQLTSEANWRQPLKWNRDAAAAGSRRRVFCASLADVFDAEAPAGALARLWELIRATPNLDWLLLTKRHGRIARSLPDDWQGGYPNVWLGVTVEDQAAAEQRIPVLLDIPARVRFLSCEPLLGPVDLSAWLDIEAPMIWPATPNGATSTGWSIQPHPVTGLLDWRPGISWVIAGGESGTGARPMHPAWARVLREQCQAAFVPFLFKQWGAWVPEGDCPFFNPATARTVNLDGTNTPAARGPYPTGRCTMHLVGKHKAGRTLDGRTWDEVPALAG